MWQLVQEKIIFSFIYFPVYFVCFDISSIINRIKKRVLIWKTTFPINICSIFSPLYFSRSNLMMDLFALALVQLLMHDRIETIWIIAMWLICQKTFELYSWIHDILRKLYNYVNYHVFLRWNGGGMKNSNGKERREKNKQQSLGLVLPKIFSLNSIRYVTSL